MPIFALSDEIIFPPVELADPSGILAVGGDLSPERLLMSYSLGIFPWYSQGDPILWWSPDPRFVLFPDELRVSRTMRQVFRRNHFDITFDRAFEDVINGCKEPRRGHDGTWITGEMLSAYVDLYRMGYAHSVEAWKDGELAGGLYGVSLGGCFFGESMFSRESNASKAAFITLVNRLQGKNFPLIDCQVHTSHLESMGARGIPRTEFIDLLNRALSLPTIRGSWSELFS
ncbi:MAG TPA: leucyl/phenylalanyl-tRNA--protein transferase [Spirochaetota bacterium]|nr:leucyl/phenylalanyl-tRNA--protein transferase [Spirochaetota bacterium]HPI90209.1 leucyl/phenylalanyl-tRNA--protein transferase [Spirochaetota bacterium]HPR46529.1 leucyl/phenylalanyl-tRNA--protein transferase [Spirochaetota bacterium]